jgi:putative cardiolipin synthase
VDNQATIVGGRNIGDEYFNAGTGVGFADLDVLAVGPVVREVSNVFDLYWNSASAYPAETLLGKARPAELEQLEARFAATRADARSAEYLEALGETRLVAELKAGQLGWEWADTRLVYDDPEKVLDTRNRADLLLLPRLLETAGRVASQFDLISPYFVPTEQGTVSLQALAAKGVNVRVLTNAFESTDVPAVHAGYAKRRKALLRGGIKLYELKRGDVPERAEAAKGVGSHSASLHAKTFQLDGDRVFVGSFNFDPRSARLNTEIGLIIHSEELAQRLKSFFNDALPAQAYEVRLDADGRDLQWLEATPNGTSTHRTEPGTSAFQRALVGLLSVLPIEWLL